MTLSDAERYVFAGLQYREGEYDCATLAVQVQRELFGREIDLPPASGRAAGRAGQGRDIRRLQPSLSERVEAPATGDGALFWASEAGGRRWHIGTVFMQDGECWVLHMVDEVRGVALQRLSDVLAQGLALEGFYRWKTLSLALSPRPLMASPDVRQVSAGQTLLVTLQRADPGFGDGQGWTVTVGGREVARKHWHLVTVKPGQTVEAYCVPRKQVLQLVAILALTYFTFGLGTYGAATSLAAGSFGFAGAAAVFVGGSILINKFLGPKLGSMGDMSGNQPPPTYSLQGGRNRARQWEPLSLVLGQTKALPDLANQPYTRFESDDQYLTMLYHAGINCGSVANLKNGATEMSTYEEVTIKRYGFPSGNTGTPPVLGTSVDSVAGGLLDAPDGAAGPYRTATSSPGTVRLEVDIQGTLTALTEKAKPTTATALLDFQYRALGGTLWQPFAAGAIEIANLGQKPVRRTYSMDVPAGQYEVRGRKTTPDPVDDSLRQHALEWTTLRSFQPDTADYGGQPRVELVAKATGQLNGSLDELSWIATAAPMPIWNGSAWVTATAPGAAGLSNPGAIILMLLRGIYRGTGPTRQLIAGAGLPDRRIDIQSLQAFMVRCATMNFRFDAIIQENLSLNELLQSVAYAGLGTMSDHSGKIGVVYAAESQPTEGIINMVSMNARSFEVTYTLARTADEYVLEFFDAESDWSWQPVRVRAPGVTTPQESSSENIRGVAYRGHAAMLARFSMGQNLYGRKTVSWEMDLEHMRYRRGAIVALSHDLTQWGFGGACAAITVGSGSFDVVVDEPVPATFQAVRSLGLNIPGEASMRVFPVSAVSADGRILTISQAWPAGAALPGEYGTLAHDYRWVYDFKESPGYRLRILTIEPGSDMGAEGYSCRITAVPDSPELWNYIINGTYVPPPNNSLLAREIPVASNLQVRRVRERIGDGWEHRLEATWDIKGRFSSSQVWAGAIGTPLEIVPGGGGTVLTTSHSWRVPPDQTWNVEVRPFDELGRPGVKASLIYSDPSVNVGVVQNLTVTAEETGMWAQWKAPSNDWLGTRLRLGTTWVGGFPVFDGKTDRHNLGYLVADDHLLWAVHINSADDESPPVVHAFEVLPPAQPIIDSSPEINEARLTWNDCRTTQPLRGYEVKIGPDYLTAVLVGESLSLGIVHTPPESGTHRYWVTAVDMANNRSAPGYVEVTTLPGISEGIAELQEGLDDAYQAILDNAADIDALNAQIADITGAGDWDAGTTYADSAIVKHEGGLWRSLQDANLNHEPGTAPSWWQKIGDYDSLGEAVAAHAIQLSDHETRIIDTESGLQAESDRIDLLAASIVSSGAEGIVADPELAQGVDSWNPTTGLTAFAATAAGVPAAAPAAQVIRADAQASGSRFNARKLRGAVNPGGDVIRVTPGEVIDLSVWVLIGGTASGATSLRVLHGPTETPATSVVIGAAVTAAGWRQVSGAFTVPAGSLFLRLGMHRTLTGTEGTAWYAGLQAARRGASALTLNAAIKTEELTRANQIEAEATARQTLAASIAGNGGNAIENSEFATSLTGWASAWNTPNPMTLERAAPAWTLGNGSLVLYEGTGPAPDPNMYGVAINTARIEVVAGRRYQVSGYTGAHRCRVLITVNFYDSSNNIVGALTTGSNDAETPGGPLLSHWKRLGAFGVAPAGSVYAIFNFLKYTTKSGNVNSAGFLARPMFCAAASPQTTLDEYVAGSSRNALQASVTTTANALVTLDGKINASYTVTVTGGNRVAGIRLGTDGVTSDFVVLADKFAWAYESMGQVKYGLVTGLIDGIPSFGFSGNMYLDGVLQARMVGAEQIRAQHIRAGEIQAYHIQVAQLSSLTQNAGIIVSGRFQSTDGQMVIDLDNKSYVMTRNGRRVEITTNGFYIGDNGGVANFLRYDLNTGQLLLRGAFTADAINAVNTLNIAGQAVTTLTPVSSPSTVYEPNAWRVMLNFYGSMPSPVTPGSGCQISVDVTGSAGNADLPVSFRLRSVTTGTVLAEWQEYPLGFILSSYRYSTNKTYTDTGPVAGVNHYVLESSRTTSFWIASARGGIFVARR